MTGTIDFKAIDKIKQERLKELLTEREKHDPIFRVYRMGAEDMRGEVFSAINRYVEEVIKAYDPTINNNEYLFVLKLKGLITAIEEIVITERPLNLLPALEELLEWEK